MSVVDRLFAPIGKRLFDPYAQLYLPLRELEGDNFISRDAYGHFCKVTGAVWQPDGRDFDGIDDIITVPDHTAITDIFDGGGTVMAWVYVRSDGEGNQGTILAKISNALTRGWHLQVREEASGRVKLATFHFFTTTSPFWPTTATELTLNTWHHVTLVYDNSNVANVPLMYVDAVLVTLNAATPEGTRVSDSGDDLEIGDWSEIGRAFDGKIDQVRWDNYKLLLPEIQNIYLNTKWRYL